MRRLADELNARFRGARVRDAGRLDDGRFALVLWAKGRDELVCFDPFAPTPLITVETGELGVGAEPGFVRAAATGLRGTILASVGARHGERLIEFHFSSRSRFGVSDEAILVCELVPRFGNLILIKGETVIAAAKEFGAARNAARRVQAGLLYQPPPARGSPATPMLADADATELATQPRNEGPLHVYRRDGIPVQAHLVPLSQFAEFDHASELWLLDVFSQVRAGDSVAAGNDRAAKRRRELERRLREREQKLLRELAETDGRLRESSNREQLREEGDAIYAGLHDLAQPKREEAKERAAALFSRYKKAGASIAHLGRRRHELKQALEEIEHLRWELERATDADLEDVAEAAQAKPAARTARKREPLRFVTEGGSRIYVGRTPLENADLTFRVAKPRDLWFHVRGAPGAHVILQRDDRGQPPEGDILAAASLAALHSKAKMSEKVTVDYTQRKYVRKRPSSAPGLVFYTNPTSVHVRPGEPQATS